MKVDKLYKLSCHGLNEFYETEAENSVKRTEVIYMNY